MQNLSNYYFGYLPQTEELRVFIRSNVVGDGDCGFTALGATRRQVVEVLLKAADDIATRHQLAGEIRGAFSVNEHGLKLPEAWHDLWKQHEKNSSNVNKEALKAYKALGIKQPAVIDAQALLQLICERRQSQVDKPHPNLVEYEKNLERYLYQQKQSDAALLKLCTKKDIYENYVKAYLGNLWLGHQSALVFAKLSNIALYIWEEPKLHAFAGDNQSNDNSNKNINAENTPCLNSPNFEQYHIPEKPDNVVHLLFAGHSTHYDVLSVANDKDLEAIPNAFKESQKSHQAKLTQLKKAIEENHQKILKSIEQSLNPTNKPLPNTGKYCCPISMQVMSNPVVLSDGRTYEKEEIDAWLLNNNISPMTNEKLPNKNIIPNRDRKSDIKEILQNHPWLQFSEEYYFSRKNFINAFRACQQQNIAQLKESIESDPRVLIKPATFNRQAILLHEVCRYGTKAMIELVYQKLETLQKGLGLQQLLESKDLNGQSPFEYCLLKNPFIDTLDYVKSLTKVQLPSKIIAAIVYGDKAKLSAYLKVSSLSCINGLTYPPLSLAAKHGHQQLIDFLITHGAKLNAVNNQYDNALNIAIKNNQLALITPLVLAGVSYKQKNQDGKSARDLVADNPAANQMLEQAIM